MTKITQKSLLLISPVLLIVAIYLMLALRPTPRGTVPLAFPLKNGTFLITQSGRSLIFGRHTSPTEKYALDIVRFPTLKSFFKFRQTNLEADITYNIPVYSPCSGSVKKIRDGIADQPIGIKNSVEKEGNLVVIACDNFDVTLAHFKKNSIAVQEGDGVTLGEEIGRVGNSGNSDGPHLHLIAYLSNDITREKTPLPLTFAGRYLHTLDSFVN